MKTLFDMLNIAPTDDFETVNNAYAKKQAYLNSESEHKPYLNLKEELKMLDRAFSKASDKEKLKKYYRDITIISLVTKHDWKGLQSLIENPDVDFLGACFEKEVMDSLYELSTMPAEKQEKIDLVRAILEKDKVSNHPFDSRALKAFFLDSAAGFQNIELVRTVLSYCDKEAVNTPSSEGSCALHTAVAFRSVKMVELLLDAGADPTIKDASGKDAFQIAERDQDLKMMRVLSRSSAGIEIDRLVVDKTKLEDKVSKLEVDNQDLVRQCKEFEEKVEQEKKNIETLKDKLNALTSEMQVLRADKDNIQDIYKMLGIIPTDSLIEVRSAYYRKKERHLARLSDKDESFKRAFHKLAEEFDKVNDTQRLKDYYAHYINGTLLDLEVDVPALEKYEKGKIDLFILIPAKDRIFGWVPTLMDGKLDEASFAQAFDFKKLAQDLTDMAKQSACPVCVDYSESLVQEKRDKSLYPCGVVRIKIREEHLQPLNGAYHLKQGIEIQPTDIISIAPMYHFLNGRHASSIDRMAKVWPQGKKVIHTTGVIGGALTFKTSATGLLALAFNTSIRRNQAKESPLESLMEKNDWDGIECLLADPNFDFMAACCEKDPVHRFLSGLIRSVDVRAADTLQKILDRAKTVKHPSFSSETADKLWQELLMTALSHNCVGSLQILLKYYGEQYGQEAVDKWIQGGSLYHAVLHGSLDVVRLLLDLGAPVNKEFYSQTPHLNFVTTPLHAAALCGKNVWGADLQDFRKIAELLVQAGANQLAEDGRGWLAWQIARKNHGAEDIEFLKLLGAEITLDETEEALGKKISDLKEQNRNLKCKSSRLKDSIYDQECQIRELTGEVKKVELLVDKLIQQTGSGLVSAAWLYTLQFARVTMANTAKAKRGQMEYSDAEGQTQKDDRVKKRVTFADQDCRYSL